MKKNLKKGIAMVMASVMMAGTLAVGESYFDNSALVYARTHTHEDIVTYTVPEDIFIPVGSDVINDTVLYYGLAEGIITIMDTETNKKRYADNTGKYFTDSYDSAYTFNNGFARVGNDRKFGFIDKTGKEVIPLIYEFVSVFSEDGYTVVQKDSKYGIIDTTNNVVIPFEYDYVLNFSDGVAMVQKGNQVSYIDTTGKIIMSVEGDDPWVLKKFSDGFAAIEKDGKYGYIDKTGAVVIPPTYDYANVFSNGVAVVSMYDEDNNNYNTAVINTSGELIVDYGKYNNISTFSEGFAFVQNGKAEGYIDTTGKEVVPVQDYTVTQTGVNHGSLASSGRYDAFHEGLAKVPRYGKYGFVDTTGNLVVSAIYDDASDFSDGLAAVRKDGKVGFIDKTGTVVIPFIYDHDYYYNKFSDGFAIVLKDGQKCIIQNPLTSNITPTGTAPTTPASTAPTATKTNSAVLVNGKSIDFQAYKIDNNNYFKLRDIAEVLSGTEKQFEVTWNNDKQSIELMSNKAYTSVGGELVTTGAEAKNVSVTTSSMYVDGKSVDLQAYKIDDNNYFKLRDLGTIFDFEISWDGTNNVITVDTSKGYTPE